MRVVAAGRDNRCKPAVRPAINVSPAVDTICGFDPETAGRFPARIAALRSISHCRNLSPEDVSVLLGYIATTNDAMSADRVAALKNDVLNLLRGQDPVPRRLPGLLVDMIDGGAYDATITDYCIQHLGSMWRDFATEGLRENARAVFAAAAARRDLPYAGTALYALADEKTPPVEYRARLRQLTVSLACDRSANPLARIAAIQLAAQKDYREVLTSVRRTLAEPNPDTVLAMVSVGTVGCLGCDADIPLLEGLRARGGVRLQPAIDAALARLTGGN